VMASRRGKALTRAALLTMTITAALLLAGGMALFSGLGSHQGAVAQAHTTSEQQNDGVRHAEDARVKSAAGHGGGRGVYTRPTESSRKQAPGKVVLAPEEGTPALKNFPRITKTQRPHKLSHLNRPPALGESFQALNEADVAHRPPDTQIAAGPNNLLVVTNGWFGIFSKSGDCGVPLGPTGPSGLKTCGQTLVHFFEPLGTIYDPDTRETIPKYTKMSDPSVAYDPYINRFWISVIA
jgi:hypothetical protein